MNRSFWAVAVSAALTITPVVVLAGAPSASATQGTLPAAAAASYQTNGTVWALAVANGAVYLAGDFTSIRPPGAAAGTGEVARNKMAALGTSTGNPTAFSHAFLPSTARPYAMAATPDGKTLYIGGNFTSVDGQVRNRLAAFDTATGALKPWNPPATSTVRALAVSGNTVFLAGDFGKVKNVARTRFAAVTADTGALLTWAPSADKVVNTIAVSTDGSRVFAGGAFNTLNSTATYAVGALDASSGATVPFPAASVMPPPSPACVSTIKDLKVYGDTVYGAAEGTGGGCYDGTFAAKTADGSLVWQNQCLGATQAIAVVNGWLYKGSHSHDCQWEQPDDPESFPQQQPNWAQHLDAENLDNGFLGPWYPNTSGNPLGPRAMATDGTSLFLGGDFKSVNNKAQQGFTRFAPGSDYAPPKPVAPAAVSPSAGKVVVFATPPVDLDDPDLTIRLYRDSGTTAVASAAVHSLFWRQPTVALVDTGVAAGSTHTYRVDALDGSGVAAPKSDAVSVKVSSGAAGYLAAVQASSPTLFWRLGGAAKTAAADSSGNLNGGMIRPGVTPGQPGAILGDADTAALFNGQASTTANNGAEGVVSTSAPVDGPSAFSLEAWFKTTTTSGGKIVGFGNIAQRGESGNYDKHVYMTNDGRLVFGVWVGFADTLATSTSYNDGQWHHVVATQGPAGMGLFVDGVRSGKNGQTSSQPYQGFWRVGGDNLGGWPNEPASHYFAGTIDDVAVYPAALTAAQVVAHYTASGRVAPPVPTPATNYGKAVVADNPDVYWPLADSSATATDFSGFGNDGTYGAGVTHGVAGAISGDLAVTLDGTDTGLVTLNNSTPGPSTFSLETWFKTTTTSGGKILGFGDQPTGWSSSYDKHLYMRDDGRLQFGVWVGFADVVTSPAAFNDGQWHHVVATQGASGMSLYVDGALVASDGQTANQGYGGYWRVGGDNLGGWPDQPTSSYFAGSVDEVAVYPVALSASQVAAHYAAR